MGFEVVVTRVHYLKSGLRASNKVYEVLSATPFPAETENGASKDFARASFIS